MSVILQSVPSFRDLGGLRTADGQRIRQGYLFRSEALGDLPRAEREFIGRLNLRLVCDLRSGAERRALPCLSWLEPPPRTLHFDLATTLGAGTKACLARMRIEAGAEPAVQLMLRTYELLPRACAPYLRTLFAALAEGELPALIYCSAGKDRTGFVTAMLLLAIGVPIASIYTDYLRSRDTVTATHGQRTAAMMKLFLDRPLDTEALAVLSEVRHVFLHAALATIEREFGGMEHYLNDIAGVSPEHRQSLRQHLLEP